MRRVNPRPVKRANTRPTRIRAGGRNIVVRVPSVAVTANAAGAMRRAPRPAARATIHMPKHSQHQLVKGRENRGVSLAVTTRIARRVSDRGASTVAARGTNSDTVATSRVRSTKSGPMASVRRRARVIATARTRTAAKGTARMAAVSADAADSCVARVRAAAATDPAVASPAASRA